MASSLFVRRFASNLLTTKSSSMSCTTHHSRGFSSPPSLEELGFVTKEGFYGSLLSKVDEVLLDRIPHTLYRLKNGEKLESVSLSIPGKEKRIETDEALTVLLDIEAKNFKAFSYSAALDRKYNAVFVTAQVEPKHSPAYPSPQILRVITSRINLGNEIMYNTIHTANKDGVIMLTFHKN
ncbi:hypothetical protein CTI12_AA144550 [Artemisia annua]|uniref:Uncharacterized protein n=1 Tax=Artemisia annua TaxID=35608 RepID=A0A2U1MUB3_ARTAN|nr:hypothetical protein CTI12_AA144550 [Artemisia annua]